MHTHAASNACRNTCRHARRCAGTRTLMHVHVYTSCTCPSMHAALCDASLPSRPLFLPRMDDCCHTFGVGCLLRGAGAGDAEFYFCQVVLFRGCVPAPRGAGGRGERPIKAERGAAARQAPQQAALGESSAPKLSESFSDGVQQLHKRCSWSRASAQNRPILAALCHALANLAQHLTNCYQHVPLLGRVRPTFGQHSGQHPRMQVKVCPAMA